MSNKSLEKWRQRHREQKLCVDCTAKAVEGKIRCQYHLDKQAEAARKRRGSK